jgi:hypothetical protein
MQWYPQKPENPHRFLLRFYSDSDNLQSIGVPSSSSGTKDIKAISVLSHISGVQAEN